MKVPLVSNYWGRAPVITLAPTNNKGQGPLLLTQVQPVIEGSALNNYNNNYWAAGPVVILH